MLDVFFISGVPASGKTTIMKVLRERFIGEGRQARLGRARWIERADGRVKMLGVFDGSTFEGTDRLSMTCIEDVIPWVRDLQDQIERYILLLEGDRLMNERFLKTTRARVFCLTVQPQTLAERHKRRRDTQGEAFLRSRETKLRNLSATYRFTFLQNDTPQEMKDNIEIISYHINRKLNATSERTL